MRLTHPSGSTVHLSYGTNVHPAQDVAGIVDQLSRYAGPVRERLSARGLDAGRLGLGLWLPAQAAHDLAGDPAALDRVREGLERAGCEVVTVNAFPYGAFHAPVVKHAVYTPDWTTDERLEYTAAAARVLAGLLPEDVTEGSVSTLPLGWRTPWDRAQANAARERLLRLDEVLETLRSRSGRRIGVALEPEPGCVIERVEQAAEQLAGLGEHLGMCLDLCHLATELQDPVSSLELLEEAGVPVLKTQVSAALHAADLGDPGTREALAGFAEDRFLHQVRRADDDGGAAQAWDDLPEALHALDDADVEAAGAWRVHFHVPLHAGPTHPGLRSTTGVLEDGLGALLGGPVPRGGHLEIETYTWSVLPEEQRPRTEEDLIAGIASEVGWAVERLSTLGVEHP